MRHLKKIPGKIEISDKIYAICFEHLLFDLTPSRQLLGLYPGPGNTDNGGHCQQEKDNGNGPG
jgi:hypothetical protein